MYKRQAPHTTDSVVTASVHTVRCQALSYPLRASTPAGTSYALVLSCVKPCGTRNTVVLHAACTPREPCVRTVSLTHNRFHRETARVHMVRCQALSYPLRASARAGISYTLVPSCVKPCDTRNKVIFHAACTPCEPCVRTVHTQPIPSSQRACTRCDVRLLAIH